MRKLLEFFMPPEPKSECVIPTAVYNNALKTIREGLMNPENKGAVLMARLSLDLLDGYNEQTIHDYIQANRKAA